MEENIKRFFFHYYRIYQSVSQYEYLSFLSSHARTFQSIIRIIWAKPKSREEYLTDDIFLMVSEINFWCVCQWLAWRSFIFWLVIIFLSWFLVCTEFLDVYVCQTVLYLSRASESDRIWSRCVSMLSEWKIVNQTPSYRWNLGI